MPTVTAAQAEVLLQLYLGETEISAANLLYVEPADRWIKVRLATVEALIRAGLLRRVETRKRRPVKRLTDAGATLAANLYHESQQPRSV